MSEEKQLNEEELEQAAGGKKIRQATGKAEAKTRHESGKQVKFRLGPETEN